jgi:hypothetical protein
LTPASSARVASGDDVVRLPPLELEVLVPERLDDRAEMGELLAQEVRHRPALRLVLGVDLLPVDRLRVPGDRNATRLVVREQLEEHVRESEQRVRRLAVGRLELLRKCEERAVGEVVAVDEKELRVADGAVVELELLAGDGLRAHPATVSSATATAKGPRLRDPGAPRLTRDRNPALAGYGLAQRTESARQPFRSCAWIRTCVAFRSSRARASSSFPWTARTSSCGHLRRRPGSPMSEPPFETP